MQLITNYINKINNKIIHYSCFNTKSITFNFIIHSLNFIAFIIQWYRIEAPINLYETTDRHNINNTKINNCIYSCNYIQGTCIARFAILRYSSAPLVIIIIIIIIIIIMKHRRCEPSALLSTT